MNFSEYSSNADWHRLEAYGFAVVTASVAAYFGQYLPPLLMLAASVLAVGFAAFVTRYAGELLGVAWTAAAILSVWTALTQPLTGFLLPLFGGIWLAIAIVRLVTARFESHRFTGIIKLPLGVPLALAFAWVGWKIYIWLFTVGIPAIQPAREAFYLVSPVVLVAIGAIVTAYCARRLRDTDGLLYRTLPALTAIFFAVTFPMYEPDGSGWRAFITWGNAAEWSFTALILLLGLLDYRRALTIAGTTVAIIFSLLFVTFSAVPSLHQFLIAQSINAVEPQHLPLSTDTPRIMPYGIGERRCVEGNAETAKHAGPVSYTMEANGINYQCALHFDGFVAGQGTVDALFSLIPGSTNKIVRVESTSTSGQVTPLEARFPFGETNSMLQSAILLRHPGAKLSQFTYSEEGGKVRLIYSYTSPRLFWFTMVPSLGGAVAESETGLLQDYTVQQAAERFPGAYLVPAELVRQKAEAWAHYRPAAWWPFRQERKFSEPGDNLNNLSEVQQAVFGNNKLPFATSTRSGPKYWLLLEPATEGGTAGSDVLLFDARYPGLVEIKDTTKGRVVKGLRDVVNQAPAVVPGNFSLRGAEVYLYVTEKDVYFIVPLLDGNGKFIGAAVLRSDEYIIFSGAATTSGEVVQKIREFEQSH